MQHTEVAGNLTTTNSILKNIVGISGVLLLGRVLGLGFLVISSRVLTPAEFGVIAATHIVIAFADMITNAGVGASLIQKKEIGKTDIKVGLLLAIMVSVLSFIGFSLSSSALARLLGISELETVIPIMATVVLINAFTNLASAILQRTGQALKFSAIQTFGTAAGTWAVALPAILYGASYWGLVAGQIAGSLLVMLISYRAAKAPLVPSWDTKTARKLARSGVGFFIAKLLAYLANQADYIVVSRVFGSSALGAYSRGYRLMDYLNVLFNISVSRVFFPAMSRLQDDPKRLASGVSKGIALSAFVAGPISALLAVSSEHWVYTIMGSQWTTTAVVLKFLAPVAFFKVTANVFSNYFRSVGRTGVLMLHNGANAAMLVSGTIFASQYGLSAVALVVSLVAAVHWVGYALRVAFALNLPILVFAKCLFAPFVLTVLVCSAAVGADFAFAPQNHIVGALLSLASYLIVIICFFWMWPKNLFLLESRVGYEVICAIKQRFFG